METKKKTLTILTYINSALILVLSAVLIVVVQHDHNGDAGKKPQAEQKRFEQGQRVSIDLDNLIVNAVWQGNKDANTTITVFNSFTCGYCARAVGLIDRLENEHSPNIKIAFKHFIRNPTDKIAAHAFECAGEQDKAMDMYRTIFAKGPQNDYSAYAREIGIKGSQFTSCMSSNKYSSKIENDLNQGIEIGISGTPAFLIQDRLVVGLQPYEVFDKVISMSKND